MSTFQPLSGDVTQTINPWTWITRGAHGQLGLININLGKSSDPTLEQQIRRLKAKRKATVPAYRQRLPA